MATLMKHKQIIVYR